MTDERMALERPLVEGYTAQVPLYERALELARGDGDALALESLNAILAEIGALDTGMAQDKAAWRAAGGQPGPELRAVLDRVTGRIRELAAVVDQRVAHLQNRKQNLLPKVDECIQQRKMLHAYAKGR